MRIFDFLEKPIFSSRFKFPIHCAQVVGAILAFSFTVPRLFARDVPRSRAGTYALGMSAKTLVLLAYLLLSERHRKFKRFHSYRAHLIIACIEVVFWSVVFGLVFSTNTAYCKGHTCALGWLVVIIAVAMVLSNLIVTGICIKEFRAWKRAGKPKNFDVHAHEQGQKTPAWDVEYATSTHPSMQQHYPAPPQPSRQQNHHQFKEPAVRAAEAAYMQTDPKRHSHRTRRSSQPSSAPRSPGEHRPRRSRERRRSSHGEGRGSGSYGTEVGYLASEQAPRYPEYQGEAQRYPGYQGYALGAWRDERY